MEMIHVCYILIVHYLICRSSVPGCSDNCVSCTDNSDQCQRCREGYWLQQNHCQLCPNGCATCTNATYCTECKTKYWNIDKSCNSVCFSDCGESGCDDKTGFCNKCPSGFYGKYCSQNCAYCKNNSCELHQCTNGCDAGYFKIVSDGYKNCKSCRNKCTHCDSQPICLECEKGYYKYRYDSSGRLLVLCLPCLSNCEECNTYKDCTVCKPGKYGSQCENDCTLSNCHRCSISDGVEMCTECDSGYELEDNKCVPCENKNRVCLNGCPNGYWGIHCNKTCSEGCASNQCTKTNGSCDSCHRNNYGDACQFMCSDSCADNDSLLHICTKRDGTCESGCEVGYSGDRCNIAPTSTITTSPSLVKTLSTTVKRSNGKVTKLTTSPGNQEENTSSVQELFDKEIMKSTGNFETTTGKNYQINDKTMAASQSTVVFTGTLAGGGVFIIVIVVVIVVCIVIKRRQGNLEDKRQYVNLTEMNIATISDTARGVESYEHSERTTKTSENVYAKLEDELRDSQHYYSGLVITTD